MSKIIYSGDYEALQTMEMVLPPKAQREWIDKELHVTEDDGQDFVQRMKLESVNTNPATRNTLKPAGELDPQHLAPEVERDFEFMPFFAERQNAEEVLYRSRQTGAEAFLDKGGEIRFLANNPAEQQQSIHAALELAKDRQWREIEITGDNVFRRQVWMEASLAGIQCHGYTPTLEDKAELEKLRPGSATAPAYPAPEAKIAAMPTTTLEKAVLFPDSKARADHELFAKLGSAKERFDASKDRPEPNRGNDLAADTSRHIHNGPGR